MGGSGGPFAQLGLSGFGGQIGQPLGFGQGGRLRQLLHDHSILYLPVLEECDCHVRRYQGLSRGRRRGRSRGCHPRLLASASRAKINNMSMSLMAVLVPSSLAAREEHHHVLSSTHEFHQRWIEQTGQSG